MHEMSGPQKIPGNANRASRKAEPVPPEERLAVRVRSELDSRLAAPLQPGLYLVATPIGNLGDISLRALAVLARADVIYCEDTRHSGRLLAHFGIEAKLKSYHEHNADRVRPGLIGALLAGGTAALISDAGTPLISDPGFKLVRAARGEDIPVIAIPGPTAAIAALTASGLPADRFYFEGFLPAKSAARKRRLEAIVTIPSTLIFYESAKRVARTLDDMAAILGPRQAVAARELTKLHETVLGDTLKGLAGHYHGVETPRGEFVLLVGPPEKEPAVDEAAIIQDLERALEKMSFRDAVRHVTEATGLPRGKIYEIGLVMKNKGLGG